MDWDALAEREQRRYEDGSARLPRDEGDARQKQLVRMAMAAGATGLVRLMQGRGDEARLWLLRSADAYRASYASAPPGSWGRLIGAVKARLLAEEPAGAQADARWALAEVGTDTSPIARYAAGLALLVLDDDERAAEAADALAAAPVEAFPAPVAAALGALARRDPRGYAEAVRQVLTSFETRNAYLEDVPVADTVLVLERLAERRGFAARLESPLLPRRAGPSRT